MELTSSKNTWHIGDIIRAPGKIVLAGEYAVLDGAPAIVLAINRGVECEIAKGSGFTTPMNDTRFIEHARPLTKDKQLIFSRMESCNQYSHRDKSLALVVVGQRVSSQHASWICHGRMHYRFIIKYKVEVLGLTLKRVF